MAADAQHSGFEPEVVAAAGRLLASARALALETDSAEWPQSAIAARALLRTCAGLWQDARQGGRS